MVFKKFGQKKKKHKNSNNTFQSEIRVRLPKRDLGEEFGIVTLMTGAEYLKIYTESKEDISGRIPGKMRNKVWIKENDVVIVRKWDTGEMKADIVWRFLPFQVQKLRRDGHLKELPM